MCGEPRWRVPSPTPGTPSFLQLWPATDTHAVASRQGQGYHHTHDSCFSSQLPPCCPTNTSIPEKTLACPLERDRAVPFIQHPWSLLRYSLWDGQAGRQGRGFRTADVIPVQKHGVASQSSQLGGGGPEVQLGAECPAVLCLRSAFPESQV